MENLVLKKGYLVLQPLSRWTQINFEEDIGKNRKIRRMPSMLLPDSRRVPVLKGNTIRGAVRRASVSYIDMKQHETVVKILTASELAGAILLGKVPFLGTPYDATVKEMAEKIPLLTLFGVGIAQYLPQRKIGASDAVPAFNYPVGTMQVLVTNYLRARELLDATLGVKLPEPEPLPAGDLIVEEAFRRAGLDDEYVKFGVDYKKRFRMNESEKDAFRKMLIVQEYAATLTPLLSMFTLTQYVPLTDVETGLLVSALTQLEWMGPATNQFNFYFAAELMSRERGEVVISVAKSKGEAARMNEEARRYLEIYDAWLEENDLAEMIISLANRIKELSPRLKTKE